MSNLALSDTIAVLVETRRLKNPHVWQQAIEVVAKLLADAELDDDDLRFFSLTYDLESGWYGNNLVIQSESMEWYQRVRTLLDTTLPTFVPPIKVEDVLMGDCACGHQLIGLKEAKKYFLTGQGMACVHLEPLIFILERIRKEEDLIPGALLLNDDELAAMLNQLRNRGFINIADDEQSVELSINGYDFLLYLDMLGSVGDE